MAWLLPIIYLVNLRAVLTAINRHGRLHRSSRDLSASALLAGRPPPTYESTPASSAASACASRSWSDAMLVSRGRSASDLAHADFVQEKTGGHGSRRPGLRARRARHGGGTAPEQASDGNRQSRFHPHSSRAARCPGNSKAERPRQD